MDASSMSVLVGGQLMVLGLFGGLVIRTIRALSREFADATRATAGALSAAVEQAARAVAGDVPPAELSAEQAPLAAPELRSVDEWGAEHPYDPTDFAIPGYRWPQASTPDEVLDRMEAEQREVMA